MNLEKMRKMVMSDNGKKSAEARKKKHGKNFSKIMASVRKGEKIT